MLVVSDASPLNVLIRCGHVNVLPGLFGTVVIPPAVRQELTHASTPEIVRAWMDQSPDWLRTQSPSSEVAEGTRHRGEREAIALARDLGAGLLLVDDLKARRAARQAGLKIIGTRGVLERADAAGLLELSSALTTLPQEFHLSPRLVDDAIARSLALRGRQHPGAEGLPGPI